MQKRITMDQEGILKYLLIGTAAFNVADYLLTVLAISMGHQEANPLINLIVDTAMFPAVKILIIPVLLYSVWTRRHEVGTRILFYSGLVFTVYFFLMVYFKTQLWIWVPN